MGWITGMVSEVSYNELPVFRCRCGHRVEQHRYAETRDGEPYAAKCTVKKCECLGFRRSM